MNDRPRIDCDSVEPLPFWLCVVIQVTALGGFLAVILLGLVSLGGAF